VLLLIAEHCCLSTESKFGQLAAKEQPAKPNRWQHIATAESRFPLAVGREGITQIMPPPVSTRLLVSSLFVLFTGNVRISGPLPSLEKSGTRRSQVILAPPAKHATDRHPFQALPSWAELSVLRKV